MSVRIEVPTIGRVVLFHEDDREAVPAVVVEIDESEEPLLTVRLRILDPSFVWAESAPWAPHGCQRDGFRYWWTWPPRLPADLVKWVTIP